MSKKSPPLGLSLIICDTVIADANTKKKSLIGIFNRLWAASFPCRHPEFHVFVSITGGHGKYRFVLQCVNETNGETINKLNGDLTFKSPKQVIEADFNFRPIVFPEPGQYSFEFLCDGEMVLHRRFIVDRVRREKK